MYSMVSTCRNEGHKAVCIEGYFFVTVVLPNIGPDFCLMPIVESLGRILLLHLIVIHCYDVMIGAMASQINSLTIVYLSVHSGADQRKHQSSASLAFVWGIHRRPVNSPHKWPMTQKMFPFDDVIMSLSPYPSSPPPPPLPLILLIFLLISITLCPRSTGLLTICLTVFFPIWCQYIFLNISHSMYKWKCITMASWRFREWINTFITTLFN